MSTPAYTHLDTPVGRLLVVQGPDGLREIRFQQDGDAAGPDPAWRPVDPETLPAAVQLRAYFDGRLRTFELALAPEGTPFQRSVWDALTHIPYGRTTTYGELARRLGQPAAVRAVGAANGRNPLPIVVPCHRVVGSDGTLTGYAGGLDVKHALLEHEGRHEPAPGAQISLF